MSTIQSNVPSGAGHRWQQYADRTSQAILMALIILGFLILASLLVSGLSTLFF